MIADLPGRVARRYATDAASMVALTAVATTRMEQCVGQYDPSRGAFTAFARHELRKACARAASKIT